MRSLQTIGTFTAGSTEAGGKSRASAKSVQHHVPGAEMEADPQPLNLSPMKHKLCAEIERVLDDRQWTNAMAEKMTGVSSQDISRIRRRHIKVFKVERLIYVLHRTGVNLNIQIEMS